MFRELVLKEIRDNVRSLKFLLASLAIVLLVIASFQTMRADYHRRLARFSSANQDPSDVSIPPNPLSIFVKGRDELIGGSFRYKPTIGISGPNPMEDHAVGFIPTPDLLFVITVVMTLVALFFSFDLISGEREAGTLQLVLSNAISRDVVILGKTLAALVCILIPFIGSVLLEVILLMGDTRVPLSLPHLERLGLLLLASVPLISCFLLLGTCASIVFSRSATSLIGLLFLWAVLVFGIPNLSPLVAERLAGVPSRDFLLQLRSQIWTKQVVEREWAERRGEKYSRQRIHEMWETIVSENRRLFEDHQRKLDRLVQYAEYVSMLSPVGCYQVVVTSLMGVGRRDYADLKRALARYYYSRSPLPIGPSEKDTAPFSYHRRSLRASFDEATVTGLGVLLVMTVLLFLIAYTLFLKADVRRV
jgi:ABC-type transport system involved in multi-copper enzyme maturation permease subunit